jgi:tRNA pseudouridine55 synthase
VSAIKRSLAVDKVGHLGTLDPFASGLLPVLIGNTARLADEAMDGEKGYLFTIGLGRETDTLDPTGRVVAEAPLPADLSQQLIDKTLQLFTGQIEQVPPVYSALKMNGMPLYEHMRASGKLPVDIESKRRTVTIHSIKVVDFSSETIALRVVCSKGTYVRSLARDIAKALGTVGTCVQLRREWVEPWHVDTALKVSLDATGRVAPPDASVLRAASCPPWSVAPKLRRAELAPQFKEKFVSGNSIELAREVLCWASEIKPSFSPGQLEKIIVSCSEVMFLCELDTHGEVHKLQPRKRIV